MSDPTEALLASATPRTTTVRVCGRGDLVDQHAELSAELQAAIGGTLAGKSGASDLARRIRDLEDEIDASAVTYTLRSIGRRAYADLQAQHPPTKDQALAGYQHNPRTFPPALIAATVTEPPITPAQSEKLAEVLPAGEWNRLWQAAAAVNLEGLDTPKSAAAAAILREKDASLATPPAPPESREASSLAGSGGRSPSTSTTTPAG